MTADGSANGARLSDRIRPLVPRYVPITAWARTYPRAWLRPDLIAALTSWVVMVPVALAYAGLAGVPPEVGLTTAFAAMAVYAVFGTSRHLKVTASSTMAIMSAAVVVDLAGGDPALYLRADGGAGGDRRRAPPRRRPGAARLRRRLPHQVGRDRVHLRPRDHDRRGAAAQAARRAVGERLRPRPAAPAGRRDPEHRPVHARDRPRVAGADPRPAPDLEADPRPADRARPGAGRRARAPPAGQGRERRGRGRHRAALDRPPDPARRLDPRADPRGRRHRVPRGRRVGRRGARLRQPAPLRDRRRPGAARAGCREHRQRPVRRLHDRREPVPDRHGRGGRGQVAAVVARDRGPHPRDRDLPRPPVRGPPERGPRCDRHRRLAQPDGRRRRCGATGRGGARTS